MSTRLIDRRNFLQKTGATAAALAFPAVLRSAAARTTKPNVLFIAVDDMNLDAGLCGGPTLTPHLQGLAARGVRFDRAYCQFPWCNPSRSSLMTGLRPDQIRVFDLQYRFRTGLPDVVTLPQMFMNHGYHAARVGKIYHASNPGDIGTAGLDDPASWQETFNPAGRDKDLLPKAINYTPSANGFGQSMAYYADPTGRDEEDTDGMIATEAIRLLERHRREPFFLGVGFYKPHCPYILPKKYFDLYPLEDITLPTLPPDYTRTVPVPALATVKPWPIFGVSREHARLVKQGYYAAHSFVDAQIGRVLGALDRLGLRDNTIVVFWSDHGFHLGDHGLWHKVTCFEQTARVPLVIAPPSCPGSGAACSRLVEHVDIYPTLADLAGLTPPVGLAGVSLRPLLENPSAEWSRPAFTQVGVARHGYPGWSVRTERWRYTQWDEGRQGEELYDHAHDPSENINLANAGGHATVLTELRGLVKEHWPVRVAGGTAGT